MVRERAGLAESDDERHHPRARSRRRCDQWVPDEDERRWIERALLALLGVEELRAMAPRRAVRRLADVLRAHRAHGPRCCVFEDIHLADPGLLDFIDHLLEWSRGLPIYVVTLARPELLERRPRLGRGQAQLRVACPSSRCPTPAMRDLLAGLVPGLPESAVRRSSARADGIPLYAVETVRMLVADGRLVERATASIGPSGDLDDLAVPETLHALIAARLDALDAADRRSSRTPRCSARASPLAPSRPCRRA